MDYEQKYNEMLDAARYWHDVSEGDIPAVLEEIFPELRESEDEKVRKAIHIYLDWLDGRNKDYQPKGDYSIKDMIAWLEKQGEQKYSLDIEIPFGAKDSELQEATYLIPEGFHAEIKDDEVIIKKGEQKPAWSEEDDSMFQSCIGAVATNDYYKGEEKEQIYDWLKSLKQKLK